MSTPPKKQPIPFGKYLLLDRINIGGMAEVWRGKQFGASGFERLVAIKRILPNIAEDEEFITMFIDEAKISVQLTHANIAQIYELGQIQSSYFIAMEYIPGKDMRAIFERCRKKGEPAPIPLTCYVLSKLCEGLDYAHRKKDGMGRDMNIVHRDVSPQNVLISYEGEVKVIDFGIAKAAGKATKTQAGILKGKFGYMSPEQIRGLPLDRRSDVFAIGVCLYEMLTGERLFVGDSDFSVLEKVRKADVLPPSQYNRRVPDSLEKIVLKSLARDVDERYQYASELADDLQRFLITSDSIFSRKDLNQYMKATFAEEVEREKIRLQEYADIKAPAEVQEEASQGYSPPRAAPPAPPLPPPPTRPMPAAAPPPAAPQASAPASAGAAPRRASLTNLPKLTAAQAAPTNVPEDAGATIISDGAPPVSNPAAPVLTSLPKLTAAAAVSTKVPEDAGATVLTTGSSEEYSGSSSPSESSDMDEDSTSPARPRVTGAGLPLVDSRLAKPAPSAAPARVPQSHGRQDTDPAIGMSASEVPTAPIVPPVLSAAAPPLPPPPPPAGGQGGWAPPTLRPVGGPEAEEATPAAARPAPQEPKPTYLRERVVLPPAHDAAPPRSRSAPSRSQPEAQFFDDDVTGRREIPRGRSKLPLFLALGAVGVLGLGGLGYTLLRGAEKGMLVINLVNPPQDVKGRAHLYINGEDRGIPASWPVFPHVPVGPALVVVTVDGYETFTRTVDVKPPQAGQQTAPLDVEFKRPGQTQPVQLVVATEPADAEVRLDGQTVKKEGVADPYLGELPVGAKRKLEVLHARYRPFTREVAATDAAVPLKVPVKLEPLDVQAEVTSEPPGATISAKGRELGTTPATLTLPADVERLTLTRKCFETVEVPVPAPASPDESVPVRGQLHRQPGCR